MRFIGSKVNLLEDIREMIKNNCTGATSFCDIFSGTTSVARFFKKISQLFQTIYCISHLYYRKLPLKIILSPILAI